MDSTETQLATTRDIYRNELSNNVKKSGIRHKTASDIHGVLRGAGKMRCTRRTGHRSPQKQAKRTTT